MLLPQLRRVRWAVRATLVLGVAASVVANVLHALDNPISQAIAAWPPLALLLTVELISRVPVHRKSLAFCRLLATAIIAGIAAWVSYWHMAGVAARYGETGASPYLLPLSVDGLIVVASICLVELGGQITSMEAEERATARAATSGAQAAAAPALPAAAAVPAVPQPVQPSHQPVQPSHQPAPPSHQPGPAGRQPVSAGPQPVPAGRRPVPAGRQSVPTPAGRQPVPAGEGAGIPGLIPVPAGAGKPARRSSTTAEALAEAAAVLTRTEQQQQPFTPSVTRQSRSAAAPSQKPARTAAKSSPSPASNPRPGAAPGTASVPGTSSTQTSSARTAPAPGTASAREAASAPGTASAPGAASSAAAKGRRTPAETVAEAAKIKARRPDTTDTQLAAELGITVAHWRTIRRKVDSQGDALQLAA